MVDLARLLFGKGIKDRGERRSKDSPYKRLELKRRSCLALWVVKRLPAICKLNIKTKPVSRSKHEYPLLLFIHLMHSDANIFEKHLPGRMENFRSRKSRKQVCNELLISLDAIHKRIGRAYDRILLVVKVFVELISGQCINNTTCSIFILLTSFKVSQTSKSCCFAVKFNSIGIFYYKLMSEN